ncbi:zona pellucida sperm-binding protein 3-like [Pungitius pungitius]|uniref:zona pellucida sperm-binding protein 3-like n=1 Tax=Pungitius pungitius TaxID=134920 RepID=UPI002E125AFC
MASRQLLVFVLACVSISEAYFLGMRERKSWGDEEKSAVEPRRPHSWESTRRADVLQPSVDQLSWRFPQDPVDVVKETPVDFELAQPATADRVAVRCGESRIQVEVSQDLLGLGKLINPEDITLGGCPATEVDSWSNVLVFDYELHNCGSMRVMTENTLVYAFTLIYNPDESDGRITRSQAVVIGVECHYQS